jgi:hypothetical protein
MRICDLQTGQIRIARAAKSLHLEWENAKEHWNDGNRTSFERQHLQPLAPQVTLLLAVTQQVADVLAQIERDCSDDDAAD